MSTKLTIGMATYDDYHGVYFTIQAIRMFHKEVADDIEIIVIDNNPHGPHGETVKKFLNHVPNSKYIPFDNFASTAVRNIIFLEASSPYVMSVDCHVFLELGTIKKLIDFYEKNPKTNNLHQGPLIYDDLNNYSTHFDPIWREEMYGIWATDSRGGDPTNEPFEIPMQGLGCFTCRRPFLRWMHRFDRPDGVKYPLSVENKIRNYFVAAIELYQTTKDNSFIKTILKEFQGRMPKEGMEALFNDAARSQGINDVFLFKPTNPNYIMSEKELKKEQEVEIIRPKNAI